jgi:DNA-binding transcriptional ArsR family regulator
MSVASLDLIFTALADPTRRAILASLATGSKTVTELSLPFEMTGPAVTKHLKVLQRAGLISVDKKAQFRPRTLEPRPFVAVLDYVEQYREFMDKSFDRMEKYLKEIQEPGEKT